METQSRLAPELDPNRPDWALTPEQLQARYRMRQPKRLMNLWRPLKPLLLAFAALSALRAAANLLVLRLPSPEESLPVWAVGAQSLAAFSLLVVAIALLGLALTTRVIFLRFMWRAANNVRISGAPLDMSPNLITFSAVIPILCYFVPYIGMKKVWRASFNPDAPEATPPRQFDVWWALWVAASVLGFRLNLNGQAFSVIGLVGPEFAPVLGAVASLLQAASILAVIPIFQILAEAQEAFLTLRQPETQSPAA